MRIPKRMDKGTRRRKESAGLKGTGGRRGSERPGQVIGAAFLMVAVSSYAQYQISALSGLVMESYQITARQYSQVFTAAMIPGILLSLLCGILCDHFGIRRCFGAAVLISGAGGILRIWSQDYRTMAACMILTGIAITFVNSNGAKLVGMLYEKKRVSAVLGLLLTGASTGMTLAMFSTARMFSGLKEAYCFSAGLFVLAAVFWFVTAPQAPGISPKRKGTRQAVGGREEAVWESLKAVLRSGGTLRVGVCLVFYYGGVLSVSSFLPLALQQRQGFSTVAAGTVTSLVLLGNMLGAVLGPRLLGRVPGKVCHWMAAAQILAAGGSAAVLLGTDFSRACILAVAAGFCINASTPVLVSAPLRLPEIGTAHGGAAGGVVATLQLLGAVCIPTLVISRLGGERYDYMILMAGGCFLINAALVFCLQDVFERMEG